MAVAEPVRILFYCIGNACRSPLAEAICRHLGGDAVEVSSAGVAPMGSVSEGSLSALRSLGISTEGLSSKGLSSLEPAHYDLVISLDEGFPVKRILSPELSFRHEDWDIPDPLGEDTEVYLDVARLLHERIEELLRREDILPAAD